MYILNMPQWNDKIFKKSFSMFYIGINRKQLQLAPLLVTFEEKHLLLLK